MVVIALAAVAVVVVGAAVLVVDSVSYSRTFRLDRHQSGILSLDMVWDNLN